MVGNNLTTSSMVREAISRKGEKSVVKQLRDNGVSEEDIESLIGKKPDKAEELGILDQRIEKQKRRFSDELGTRDERMAALGTREQRMAALPR